MKSHHTNDPSSHLPKGDTTNQAGGTAKSGARTGDKVNPRSRVQHSKCLFCYVPDRSYPRPSSTQKI